MKRIRCNWCMWVGFEEDLYVEDDLEYCPDCNSTEHLMDSESDGSFLSESWLDKADEAHKRKRGE